MVMLIIKGNPVLRLWDFELELLIKDLYVSLFIPGAFGATATIEITPAGYVVTTPDTILTTTNLRDFMQVEPM